MQSLTQANAPLVVVDYAHTPDALEKVLAALRPITQSRGGQLHCIFGCGGDRDAAKRPLMAAAAERGAAHIVVTSDNPRSEAPEAIIAQIIAGLAAPARAQVEPDRAQAIAQTLAQASAQDVVLIAGKGHEDYQDMAGTKHPFSDVVQAQKALQKRAGRKTA
jgi:UDP-N-acetylmuramyl tripeptide synthase